MIFPIQETKSYPRGIVGKILYDPHPQPYDGDTISKIAYLDSGRYTLGNERVSEDRMDEIRDKINSGEYLGVPIFAYVHSGVTIKAGSGFSCPWDSGQSGFAYVERSKALEEFPGIESAMKAILCEVKIFDAYLTGEVYGYVIEDADGDEIDSCWDFYGDDEIPYMLSEMDSFVESYLRNVDRDELEARAAADREEFEASYWAERDVTTIT